MGGLAPDDAQRSGLAVQSESEDGIVLASLLDGVHGAQRGMDGEERRVCDPAHCRDRFEDTRLWVHSQGVYAFTTGSGVGPNQHEHGFCSHVSGLSFWVLGDGGGGEREDSDHNLGQSSHQSASRRTTQPSHYSLRS